MNRSRGVTSRRRRFLQGIGAAGMTGVLAGCSDDEGEDPNGEEEDADPAFFEVSSLDPESESVTEEGVLDVAATVTNTGESEGTQEIELRAGGETLDSRELTLDADESDTVSFEGIDAADLGPGEYTHGLHSDDDDETGSLIVEELEPAVFEIDDLEPGNATVGQGETVTLSATVENTGEAEGGRPVRITGTATTNTRRR